MPSSTATVLLELEGVVALAVNNKQPVPSNSTYASLYGRQSALGTGNRAHLLSNRSQRLR